MLEKILWQETRKFGSKKQPCICPLVVLIRTVKPVMSALGYIALSNIVESLQCLMPVVMEFMYPPEAILELGHQSGFYIAARSLVQVEYDVAHPHSYSL